MGYQPVIETFFFKEGQLNNKCTTRIEIIMLSRAAQEPIMVSGLNFSKKESCEMLISSSNLSFPTPA